MTEVFGVGPVIAATVIGDVRDVSRFASRDHFAAYNGTAPIEVSSGNRIIYRLSLRGNRRLNHAIHMAAITQIRYQHSDGRAYYDKKIAEGKTPKEALRALKRQISDAIYKHLKADAARAAAAGTQGPGGHPGNDSVASAAGLHPERQLFGQATPDLTPPYDAQLTSRKGRAHAPGKRPHEPLDTKRHRSARFAGVGLLWSRLCITGSIPAVAPPPADRSAAAAGRAGGSGCAGLQVGGHLGEGADDGGVLVGADAAEEQVAGLLDSLPGYLVGCPACLPSGRAGPVHRGSPSRGR